MSWYQVTLLIVAVCFGPWVIAMTLIKLSELFKWLFFQYKLRSGKVYNWDFSNDWLSWEKEEKSFEGRCWYHACVLSNFLEQKYVYLFRTTDNRWFFVVGGRTIGFGTDYSFSWYATEEEIMGSFKKIINYKSTGVNDPFDNAQMALGRRLVSDKVVERFEKQMKGEN